jgi:hypothetical protein
MAAFAVPLAMAGIQGLAGLFGGRKQVTTATGTQDSATTNNYSPEQQRFMQQIMQQYQQQMNGTDLSGYQQQGLQDINRTSDASEMAIKNILAQRGLSFSPAASSALVQNKVGQAGQQSQFLNSIPLLQYKLKADAVAGAGAYSNGQRVNTSTHTTSSQRQEGSGNMLGGMFAGIGTGIADTLGRKFANSK